MKPTDFDLIYRAFKIFNGFDGPNSDELWWRTDIDGEQIRLLVNCNDLFWWGTADCEQLTYENIGLLESTYEECTKDEKSRAHLLWIARIRRLVPQEPYFKYFPESMHAKFRACTATDELRNDPSTAEASWCIAQAIYRILLPANLGTAMVGRDRGCRCLLNLWSLLQRA